MNKKVLLPVMVLLVLFAVAPVMAAPAAKINYIADVSLEIMSSVEDWTTAGGIRHVKGVIAEGDFDTRPDTLSISGDMLKEFDLTLNINTGKGTLHGKFVLTVGVDTLEGSFSGKITDGTDLAGTVVGHGTGGFEGVKTMGTWSGTVDFDAGEIENVLEGILLFPR